jgi:hypothetical protein
MAKIIRGVIILLVFIDESTSRVETDFKGTLISLLDPLLNILIKYGGLFYQELPLFVLEQSMGEIIYIQFTLE